MQAKVVGRWVPLMSTEDFECWGCGYLRQYWPTLIPGGPDTCPQCGRGQLSAREESKLRRKAAKVRRRHLRSLRDRTLTTTWDGNKFSGTAERAVG